MRILNLFPHEDIGWKDIGETFIRYTLIKTPWFRVYLHNLIAPIPHPQCHNHPWNFIAVILKGGYLEYTVDTGWKSRLPLDILFRPHGWTHNVVTTRAGMWSLVFTGPKKYSWRLKDC